MEKMPVERMPEQGSVEFRRNQNESAAEAYVAGEYREHTKLLLRDGFELTGFHTASGRRSVI